MLINVNQVLKTMDNQPMKDNDGQGNAIDATLKLAIINALLSPVERESGADKLKKYELAKKIFDADEIGLTVEEISLIKKRVGEVFPTPIIVGQVFNLLENKDV